MSTLHKSDDHQFWQLSSTRTSLIPQHIHNILAPSGGISSALSVRHSTHQASRNGLPLSAPILHSQSWHDSAHLQAGSRIFSNPGGYSRSSSRLSESAIGYDSDDDDFGPDDLYNNTIRNGLPSSPYSAPTMRSVSVMSAARHAIATPPPTLLFAIASDDVAQVKRVLESGDAGPNDHVGPQSALAFTLTNDKLKHKLEIVKALLAFGADPSALRNPDLNPPQRSAVSDGEAETTVPFNTFLEGMDPATKYVPLFIVLALDVDLLHKILCRAGGRPLNSSDVAIDTSLLLPASNPPAV
jgi:hypothetical protein